MARLILPFTPGAVAQRRDRHAAAGEVRRHVGHVAGHHEVVGAASARIVAGTLLPTMYVFTPGSSCAHVRQDLLRVPQHGVGVGRMLETADEHEALALGERAGRAACSSWIVRQHHHARLGHELGAAASARTATRPASRRTCGSASAPRRAWRGPTRARPASPSSSACRSLRRKCRSTVSNTTSAWGANARTASMCFTAM